MTKKTLRISCVTFIITAIIISVTYIYLPIIQIRAKVVRIQNSTYTVKSNRQVIEFNDNSKNREQYYKEFYSNLDYITSNYNPINPVVTFVGESKESKNSLYSTLFILEKNNFDFEIKSQQQIIFQNKSFQEAVEIARKYDLTKENPDPANITVYPAPTKEEVEREKKNETIKSNPTRKAREDICNNLIAPLSELTNKAGGTTTPEITTKTKELNDCFAQLEKDFPTEPDPKFPNI